jgi:hypothetical protein
MHSAKLGLRNGFTAAVVALMRRRLHKTPVGVLEAFSGHPDFRNDLIFQVRDLANHEQRPISLKSNLSEQNSFQYWIDWGSKGDVISQ